MIRCQLFQYVRRGGDGFALAVLDGRRQVHLLEQHLPHLLRRADIKRAPGQAVDLARQPRDFRLHQARHPLQLDRVDPHAGALHPRQHPRQRQLDRFVQVAQAARIHRRAELAPDLERDIGVLLGRRTQFQVQPAPRLLFERTSRRVRIQQERVEHHVVDEPARFDPHAVEREQRPFDIARDLGPRGVFEPRLQVRQVFRGDSARFPRGPRQPYGIERELSLRRFRDGHGVRPVPALFQPFRQIFGAGDDPVVPCPRILARLQLLQQAVELEFLIDRLERRRIERLRLHRCRVERDRHVDGDRGQALAHADPVHVVLEALAVHLALHFGRPLESRLHRSELFDQVPRAFVPDARRARNVIDGIALQRQQVGHLVRPHAHEFLHLFRVVPFIVFGGVEHRHFVRDELQQVLVARNDDYFESLPLRRAGQRPDHVIRLETGILQNGNPHGLQHPPHQGDLLQQVGRCLRTVGFVLRELLRPVGRLPTLEDGRDIGRLELLGQLPEHVVENVHSLGG